MRDGSEKSASLFFFWYTVYMEGKQKLHKLFHPRSIAIVGASSTKGKVGQMIAKNVVTHGFSGDVYFVNPKRKTIFGKKCYPGVSAIGKNVDCAVIAVPAAFVVDVVRDAHVYCKNFVVISAGFGESGTEGHNREVQLNLLAKELDVRIVGPNCLGFLVPSLGLNASFAEGLPADGHTALVSQSGALAVAMMDKAQIDHVGFSLIVSIGNKMHIGAADVIDYLITDKKTRVIALYLEGVVRGTDFLRSLARAKKVGKKVIILKSGQSTEAQGAIALHTGSLAGDDAVFSAAVDKVGAVRAQTMGEFFALVRLGAYCDEKDFGHRIGIVTNAGGPGVLATDIIAQLPQIQMSTFTQKTKKALQSALPDAASVHNPVDVLGDADISRYRDALHSVVADQHTDVIVVLLTPQDHTPIAAVADLLVEVQKKTTKMIIASFIGGERVDGAIAHMREYGILHFAVPYDALNALAQFLKEKRVFALTQKSADKTRRKKAKKVIDRGYAQGGLYFADVTEIARLYGVPIARHSDVTDGFGADMHIQYPCVAKVDSPHVLHKTDRGGVLTGIRTLRELHHARTVLQKTFPSKDVRIIVQKMLPIKMELIIGMKRDPIFDTVIVVGLGGIYVEVFRAVDYYIAPLSLSEIKKILTEGTLSFLFDGTRGEECYNSDGIARSIYALALMSNENPEIRAIDINPLFIYNNDTADVAVDCKIII